MLDPHSIFNQKKQKSKTSDAGHPRDIGIALSLPCLPLVYGLQEDRINHQFKIQISQLNANGTKLREGEIDLGLISSIDYALKKESWRILPGIGISSKEKGKYVQLFFKKGLRDLKTIAVDNNAGSELTLLQILMREKFTLSPSYFKMEANLEQMFSKAEAALIIGDHALHFYHLHQNRLDLAEEWTDLTGLPFVYAFWAGRDLMLTPEDLKMIQLSHHLGTKNLENIAKTYAEDHSENWAFYHDLLTKNLTFSLSEDELEGLNEFYQYSFFYGFSEFIPDLLYYDI